MSETCKLYEVNLSHEELLLLDGKVRDSAQSTIDTAKREFSIGFDLPIMNKIINDSIGSGKLTFTNKRIDACSLCDKKRDYFTYPRSGKYHSKGDKNYNKPKSYAGVKFNEGFVTFRGHGDMCSDCLKEHDVINRLYSYVIDHDLKIQLQDKTLTKYIKDVLKECFECKAEIQESKMGMLPAMMGGEYPGECPFCNAKSLPFGRSHNITNKHVMITAQ